MQIRELQCPELEEGILKQKTEIKSSFVVVRDGIDIHDWGGKVISPSDWLWAIQVRFDQKAVPFKGARPFQTNVVLVQQNYSCLDRWMDFFSISPAQCHFCLRVLRAGGRRFRARLFFRCFS